MSHGESKYCNIWHYFFVACFIFNSMGKHVFWYFKDTCQSRNNLQGITAKTINHSLAVSINPENKRIYKNCIKQTTSKEFHLWSCNFLMDMLVYTVMCTGYPEHFVYLWVSSASAIRNSSSRNCWLSSAASEEFCLEALQLETGAEVHRLFANGADLVCGAPAALACCLPPHHLSEGINAPA